MRQFYNNGSYIYQREPYNWAKVTETKEEPIQYATKKELRALEDRVVKLTSAVGKNQEDVEWLLQNYNGGVNNVVARLNAIEDYTRYLHGEIKARKGTHKRRKVVVKSGNEVVEVTRNG